MIHDTVLLDIFHKSGRKRMNETDIAFIFGKKTEHK